MQQTVPTSANTPKKNISPKKLILFLIGILLLVIIGRLGTTIFVKQGNQQIAQQIPSVPPKPLVKISPDANAPTQITWTRYTDKKNGFSVAYPDYWNQRQEYNADAYIHRSNQYGDIKAFHLPSDLYDLISLASPYSIDKEKDISGVSIYMYNNPNKLTLTDFFRGMRTTFGEDPADDSLQEITFSQSIQKAPIETIGNFNWKELPLMKYGDINNAKNSNYITLSKDHTKIIRFDFAYWVKNSTHMSNEDILKAQTVLPDTAIKKINNILVSFTYK
jgi:hypothetical protein